MGAAERHHFLNDVVRDSADRKSTRLNSSHSQISYAVFCLKKKKDPSLTAAGSKRGGLGIMGVGDIAAGEIGNVGTPIPRPTPLPLTGHLLPLGRVEVNLSV